MENIIFAANVVLPLLLVMAAGYAVRQLNWLTGSEASTFNSIAFMVFLPALLFNNVRNSSLAAFSNPMFFLFVIVGSLVCFAIPAVVVPMIEPLNSRRGVMIQGMGRTNYSLFGIPLLTLMMPGADIGLASILIAVVIPIYNVVSVIILTYYGSKTANFKAIALGISKNPLIISTFIGIIFLLNGWELPAAIDSAFTSLGNAASPLCLFLLGSSFEFKKLNAVIKQTVITVVTRLLVIPAIVLTLAIFLGYRGMELACVMIVFSSPTAISSYTMAEKMGGDGPLASAVVLFTTLFSIVTLFFIIFVLKTLGMF